MQTLTLDQLRPTSGTGSMTAVTVKAQDGWFVIQVLPRSGGSAVLSKARSRKPRHFGTPVQAMALLHKLGISVGTFDLSQWHPAKKDPNRARPDRSEALKQAHHAAAHDRWFREQIAEAVAEADDPATPWLSQESVREDIGRQRDALRARLGRGAG